MGASLLALDTTETATHNGHHVLLDNRSHSRTPDSFPLDDQAGGDPGRADADAHNKYDDA